MPITLPETLPAYDVLRSEGVMVMSEDAAATQDITAVEVMGFHVHFFGLVIGVRKSLLRHTERIMSWSWCSLCLDCLRSSSTA